MPMNVAAATPIERSQAARQPGGKPTPLSGFNPLNDKIRSRFTHEL
jgi:hypothetical protein